MDRKLNEVLAIRHTGGTPLLVCFVAHPLLYVKTEDLGFLTHKNLAFSERFLIFALRELVKMKQILSSNTDHK